MEHKNSYILHGSGEHARVVLDALLDVGIQVVGIFDPKYSESLFEIKQLGVYNPAYHPEAKLIIAIGDNTMRMKAASIAKHDFGLVKHQSTSLSSRAKVGPGSMLLQGSVIQAQANLGAHVIVNTGACVDHDCILEDYVHIAPGAVLCGSVTVGEGSFIGAGATIIQGKKIGRWCTVGAGAVVINDVPDYALVVGNPGKIKSIKASV